MQFSLNVTTPKLEVLLMVFSCVREIEDFVETLSQLCTTG